MFIPLPLFSFFSLVPKSLDISASKVRHIKRKKKSRTTTDGIDYKFNDVYELTTELLGVGARSTVITCIKKVTRDEYAVKVS